MTIWGVQVQDKNKKAAAMEMVLEGQRVFTERFGFPATHAQVHVDAGVVEVDGLVVSNVRHVQPHEVIVGIPTVADHFKNLKDPQEDDHEREE